MLKHNNNSEGTKLKGIREKLFMDRYSLKDENGKPVEKYPEQSWKRMAKALAQVESTNNKKAKWEKEFYKAMENFKFVPAGRVWCSAGTGTSATMINCFVIPSPKDSRQGIIKTLEYVTEISARGGGLGFNLSSLRPRGSYIKKVNGTTSGSVCWADLYSRTVHDIIQQGGTRRGALMLMLRDWHPDIEEFITVKKTQGKLLGANLSVCVSDVFMDAVKKDKSWKLKFPDTAYKNYDAEWDGDIVEWEKKGYPTKVYKTISARFLWDLICKSAWASAEPGVVFLDRYNAMNNGWYFEKIIATNPCGEQGLPAWGVCNLSSINLSSFVINGEFDFNDFEKTIGVGIRFLDNAIDLEKYIYKEIEDEQIAKRRIGLGTMGLADALIKMKVRYGSEESLAFIKKVYKMLRDVSYETSSDLAKERGKFPMFKPNKYLQGGFTKTLPDNIRKKIKKQGIRNSHLITEAPTGKISLLAGVSSGIEPVFSFSYKQKDRLGERTMYHPLYQKWVDENLPCRQAGGKNEIPAHFVVADDLTPEEHVKVQALIQRYTDSSISKTVNAPEIHTVDDVKKLYEMAYETGCKGISYMREGSREGTLIRNKEEEDSKSKGVLQNDGEIKTNGELNGHKVWERPMKVAGSTYKLKTPVGTAFITVNHDQNGAPFEVFINIGRAGSDVQAMAEALGRLISKALRFSGGMSPKEKALAIIDQFKGIGGMRPVGFGVNRVTSLPDAIAKALSIDLGLTNYSSSEKKMVKKDIPSEESMGVKQLTISGNGNEDGAYVKRMSRTADYCPDCGNATLVHEMGCKTCHRCGYSEC
ncbi:adenosylcobalamin-dependent ribonucleoside-diphosphate reductase [Patescibacteria group bacterium]|nr:adenosylcobalamin-dependent ribonucleoside-diphosphate reductase [Patescibacteria group bacterium]